MSSDIVMSSDSRPSAMKLELSDVTLRQFHVATYTSPEWAQHALADDISNTNAKFFNLYKKFKALMSGL